MVSMLWQKVNYNIPIPYITSVYITEYDIAKANINALLSEGVIDEKLYMELYNSAKSYREIYIGNMIRNDIRVYKAIQDGIRNAKRMFFESNELTDNDILSIRNDAVFIMGNKNLKTEFGNYVFKKKSIYKICINTSNKLQILYNYDPLTCIDTIDIKGIGDDMLVLHQDYMLKFLCDICYGILNSPITEVLDSFNRFHHKYINRELPIGYYREFDPFSVYRIISMKQAFGLPSLQDKDLCNIDINCNLALLRDIHFVISDIYANIK